MQPEQHPPNKKTKSGNKTILGSLGVLGVLALKFKFYLMAALKALPFLKISWILSPLITIGLYAMVFGFPYAMAIFVILLIHEMGHWVWMKALGLEPKLPVFVPFIGAYVAMTKLPPDQATRAWVSIAGPLVGGVGSAALFWFGVQNNNTWMMAAGNTGFFLNLFQLIPAKPFDGGFIIQAISKWLLIPGVILLIGLTILFQSILLFFISIISIVSLVRQLREQKISRQENPSQSPFYDQSVSAPAQNTAPKQGLDNQIVLQDIQMQPATAIQRLLIATAYIGLAGCLAWLYRLSSDDLTVFLPHH